MKYTCTVLSVADIHVARTFYEELFGLEVFQDYGINIAFTDTLTIDRKSTDDSLFLRQGTNVQAFGRLRR